MPYLHYRLLLVTGLLALSGCGEDCLLTNCGTSNGGAGGGSGSGGSDSAVREDPASLWTGRVEVTGAGEADVTVVVDGTVLRYRLGGGETVELFFDGLGTGDQGDAFIAPPKGSRLSNGQTIDAGDVQITERSSDSLNITVDFDDTADQGLRIFRNDRLSNVPAEPANIAGDYFATAADGTQYTFTVSGAPEFIGFDNNGCDYLLDTVLREGDNVYVAVGDFDPDCEAGGANFIDAAYWLDRTTFDRAVWFVDFRGETFNLDVRRF